MTGAIQTEWWQLGCAMLAGAMVGLFFFGGLWLTVTRIHVCRRPYLLLASSFLLRMAAALTAFYALLPWGWQALVVAGGGLLVARQVLLKIKGHPVGHPADAA